MDEWGWIYLGGAAFTFVLVVVAATVRDTWDDPSAIGGLLLGTLFWPLTLLLFLGVQIGGWIKRVRRPRASSESRGSRGPGGSPPED